MRLKQRVGDFRVRELLSKDYLGQRGAHRVYRVTKRKLTSDEAARAVAQEAGVEAAQVSLAGLKDRQGITIQYMSVPGGREVRLELADLKVETVGFAERPLASADSEGNAFELTVRALRRSDVARLRVNVPLVREHGTINYFDDQRFGNLTHGQGWLYRDLCLGRHEGGLRNLLGARSPRDDDRHRRFKDGLERHWGDWRACRDVAGRFGAHHSIFEHLNRDPEDFAGAFAHVATRLKLIHLYAWQSYLWNRAVVELVRECVPMPERVLTEGVDGPLVGFAGPLPPALAARAVFPLPGERLEGVAEGDRRYFQAVLEREGLAPEAMAVQGVAGFALKPEERPLILAPRHLRVRPAEPDNLNPSYQSVRVRFELPRGGYATLVVKRLFATALGDRDESQAFESGSTEDVPDADRPPREGPGPWRAREGGRAPHDGPHERHGGGRRQGPRSDERSRGRPWERDRGRPWEGGAGRSDDRRSGGDPRHRDDRHESGGRHEGGGRRGGPPRDHGGDRQGNRGEGWRDPGRRGASQGPRGGQGQRWERDRSPRGGPGRPEGHGGHHGGQGGDQGSPGRWGERRDDRRGQRRDFGPGRPQGGAGGRGGHGRPGGPPWRSGGGHGQERDRRRDDDRHGAGDRRGAGGPPGGRPFRGRDETQGRPGGHGSRGGFGKPGRRPYRRREDERPRGADERPRHADERPDAGPERSEE